MHTKLNRQERRVAQDTSASPPARTQCQGYREEYPMISVRLLWVKNDKEAQINERIVRKMFQNLRFSVRILCIYAL